MNTHISTHKMHILLVVFSIIIDLFIEKRENIYREQQEHTKKKKFIVKKQQLK